MLLLALLIVAGDVESNPGPNETRVYAEKTESFSTQEVLDILHNPDWNRVVREPPVKPRAGQVFLYHFTEDSKKDDWRCDQYHFHHDATRKQPKGNPKFNKLFFVIKTGQGKDNRFKKHAYILLEGEANLVLFQYLGDDSVAEDLPHGNSKNPNSVYTRVCPSLLRAIKSISLKPTDALKQLNSEAEGSSVPDVFRPRSLIHIINTKCRGKDKAKQIGNPTLDENLQKELHTTISTTVSEKGRGKRRNGARARCEPESKRIRSHTDDDQFRKELESCQLQTICPKTPKNICPHLADAGYITEEMSSIYHTTSTTQESGEAQAPMDTDNETVESRTHSPAGSNGISSMLSDQQLSSDTGTECHTASDTRTANLDSSFDVPHKNETQSSSGGCTYHISTTKSSFISTNNKFSAKVQDQHTSPSSNPALYTFQCSNSDVGNRPCIIVQEGIQTETGNIPVLICEQNIHQGSKCSSNDTNRLDIGPVTPKILHQQLCISSIQEIQEGIQTDPGNVPAMICEYNLQQESNCSSDDTNRLDVGPVIPEILHQKLSISSVQEVQEGTCIQAETSNVPAMICEYNLQQESKCVSNDTNRQDTGPPQICDPLQQQLGISAGFLTETIKLLSSIVTRWNRLQHSTSETEGQAQTIPVVDGDEQPVDDIQSTACDPLPVVEILPQTAASLINQTGQLSFSEFMRVRQVLTQSEIIRMSLQSEIQTNDSFLTLLTAILVGAQTTRSNVIQFMETLNDPPGHLQNINKSVSEVETSVDYNIGSYRVSGRDINRLSETSWLDDNVIHAFLWVLQEQFSKTEKTFVFPCFLQQKWEESNYTVWHYEQQKFKDFTWILLPVCRNSHWFLLVANVRNKTVGVINSSSAVSAVSKNRIFAHWRTYMNRRSEVTGENLTEWREESYPIFPQTDGSSCGVYVLMAAEALLSGVSPGIMRNCHVTRYRMYVSQRLMAAATPVCRTQILDHDTNDVMVVEVEEEKEISVVENNFQQNNMEQNNKQRTDYEYDTRKLCSGNDCEDTDLMDNFVNAFDTEIQPQDYKTREPVESTDHDLDALTERDMSQNVRVELVDASTERSCQVVKPCLCNSQTNKTYHLQDDRTAMLTKTKGFIENLYKNNKTAFTALTLLCLLNGNVTLSEFENSNAESPLHCYLKWSCELSGLLDSHMEDIKRELTNLDRFIQITGNKVVKLRDPDMQGLIYAAVSDHNTDYLFRIDLKFIYHFVRIEKQIPFSTIVVTNNNIKALASRFAKEILQGNLALTVSHDACRYYHFNIRLRKALLEELENENLERILQISDNYVGGSFIHWLCFAKNAELFKCLSGILTDDHKLNSVIPCCVSGNVDILKLLCTELDKEQVLDVSKCNQKLPTILVNMNIHEVSVELFETHSLPPVHLACYWGHCDIVACLLAHGLDVNEQLNKGTKDCESIQEGSTPACIAAARGHTDVIKCLIDHKADLNLHDTNYNTPLHHACKEGHWDMVGMMIQHCNVSERNTQGDTPLHIACQTAGIDGVKILMRNGSDCNLLNYQNNTPLDVACEKGSLCIVEYMIDTHGYPLPYDGSNTPLHKACRGGFTEVVQLLLKHNAGRSVTFDEHHPLDIAVSHNFSQITKLLLSDCSLAISFMNRDNNTPLNVACSGGYVEIVKLLLEKGADVSVTDSEGCSPLRAACERGHVEIVKLLLEKGADVPHNDDTSYSLLNFVCERGCVEIVKLLLEKGADVSLTDKLGYFSLNAACEYGHIEIVKLLLEKGADVSVTDVVGYSPLNAACENGHADIVKLLLEKGADVSLTDEPGYISLNAAYKNGHIEIVKLLLEKGADVPFSVIQGYSLLKAASENGHIQIVKLLLEKGADVSVTNIQRCSPLNAACEYGHIEIVKLLLDKGVNVSVTDKPGYISLNAACEYGHIEIVKLLLDKGVDVSVTDKPGYISLNAACEYGHIEIVKLLLDKGADVSVTDKPGYISLNAACENGHIEIVKLLLEKGADVSVTDIQGCTPLNGYSFLSAASENGHIEIVKLLLEKGADVSVTDIQGNSPLSAACENGHIKIVKLLLEKGADVSVTDIQGNSPLSTACENGHVKIVKLLLDKGADVSVTDIQGYSPLSAACENGYVEIVKLLLDKEADMSVTDIQGYSPLSAACEKGHVEIVKLLLDNGANVIDTNTDRRSYSPLSAAQKNGHVEIMRLLLEKGADVSVPDIQGYLPLSAACREGHVEIVKLLLEKGADVSVTDALGYSPLSVTSENGHVEIVKLLLDTGADVSATDRRGYSPLSAASENGHIVIVRLLLDKEADMSVTDIQGYSPLSAACENGHVEIVKLLLDNGANVSATDRRGYSPMSAACKRGHVEIVKLFLKKGVDVSGIDIPGITPLSTIIKKGHVEIVKLLLEEDANVSVTDMQGYSPLSADWENGHVEIVKLLLEKCLATSDTDDQGYSPFSSACKNGRVAKLKLLFKNDDYVSVTDRHEAELSSGKHSACENKSKTFHNHVHGVLKHAVSVGDGHMLRLVRDRIVTTKPNKHTLYEILLMSLTERKYYIFQMMFGSYKYDDIKAIIDEAYYQGSAHILKMISGGKSAS